MPVRVSRVGAAISRRLAMLLTVILGLGLTLSFVAPENVASASGKVVHAGAYIEFTAPNKDLSLNGVPDLLIVKTPPLPAGSYLASATAVVFSPETLQNGNYSNTNYDVQCYINEVPNKSGTYDQHYGFGMMQSNLSVSDVFVHVRAGTQLGFYCYEYEANSNSYVYYANLEAIPFSSISVN